jgi:glycosyltransferase domain-containing protein
MKDKNLTRLTFVVPTYERRDYVLRLMNYWVDKGPRLIVMDGSAEPIEPEKLDAFAPHIQYLHRPVGIYMRVAEALDLIQTEFVALAGDDEFYISSAVESCIEELVRDDGLIACCGRAIGFGLTNQFVFGRPQYPRLEGYSVDSRIGESRIRQHMSDYVPSLVYAICRAQQWKTAWKYVTKKEFPFFAAGEIQIEMCMAYAGRSKVIPELMWFRSRNETKPVRGTDPSLDERSSLPSWWNDTSKATEHEEFVSIMSEAFNKLLPEEGGDTKRAVVTGVETYLDRFKKNKNRHRVINSFRKAAVKIVPDRIKPFVRNSLRILLRNKAVNNTELLDAVKNLERLGVQVDFKTVAEIEKIIIKFHQNRKLKGS